MRRPQGENGVATALMPACASSFCTSAPLVGERVHPQVERRGLLQAVDQRPEFAAQLLLERLHQPFGQVVAMALQQVVGLDGVAVVEPALFDSSERALQEVARTVKAEDGHAPLLRPAAGRRQVVEQQLLAQHGVDGFGQRGALARPERAVVAEEAGDNLVGWMIEFQDQADQFGAGIEQGFGMHGPIVSAARARPDRPEGLALDLRERRRVPGPQHERGAGQAQVCSSWRHRCQRSSSDRPGSSTNTM